MSTPQTEAGRRLLAMDDFETASLDDEAVLAIVLAIEAEAAQQPVLSSDQVERLIDEAHRIAGDDTTKRTALVIARPLLIAADALTEGSDRT